MRTAVIAVLIACLPPVAAHAGLLDDTADLKGKTIVYAGEIEQVSCPVAGKYDCLQWPRGFYKTRDNDCFVTDETSCSYTCNALVAVDRGRQLSIYVLPSIGGGMKKGSFTSYKCPSPY